MGELAMLVHSEATSEPQYTPLTLSTHTCMSTMYIRYPAMCRKEAEICVGVQSDV